MALAYLLWTFWGHGLTPRLAVFGTLLGTGIVAGLFTLHLGFNGLLGEGAWQNTQLNTWAGAALAALVLVLFLAVLLVQTEIPQWANRPFFQALYVHARNGFYLNTLANRAVAAIWPVKSSATPE
jgi:NAD(P)H-quinone oxidoreductase subunit 5